MSINLGDMANIDIIVERIKSEAEDLEQMSELVQGEVGAYYSFMNKEKPFRVNMYDRAIPIGNNSVVGEIFKTEEDFDDDYAGYIIVRNEMHGKTLKTWYEIIWKLQ